MTELDASVWLPAICSFEEKTCTYDDCEKYLECAACGECKWSRFHPR